MGEIYQDGSNGGGFDTPDFKAIFSLQVTSQMLPTTERIFFLQKRRTKKSLPAREDKMDEFWGEI